MGVLAVFAVSCSTSYQAGQTPDDVYYSPTKERGAREEYAQQRNTDTYQAPQNSEDDNYLRMRVRNRSRWNSIDDFDYWSNPYRSNYYSYNPHGLYSPYNYNAFTYNGPMWNTWGNYNYNLYGSNFYSPYFGWSSGLYNHGVFNNYGSGYYGGSYYPAVIVKNPVRATNNVSRPSLNSYKNGNYNNSNQRRPIGETFSKIFSPSQNSGYSNSNSNSSQSRNSEYQAPARSYNPPASSSSNSSSASGNSSSSGSTSTGTRPPR